MWIVGAAPVGRPAAPGVLRTNPPELEHADAGQNLAEGHEHQGELPDVPTGDVVVEREASDRGSSGVGDPEGVFVSSHLMSELALTADNLVVIGRGRLIAEMPVDDFIARVSP